ncbi:MAG TPA: PfkB family carbohydrate kinase [Opitutaceae bacterium]|nr:PfkB family carbohydrate kinase [Opitutaceae bacterium]
MNSPSPAPHIFTLTGNLLAERTLTFATWSAGKTQRATGESFQVGGKGINVSKMLNRLGAANTALCFAGGAAGAECENWLRERNFTFKAFATTASTRVGTVVRSDAQPETTFLAPDVVPDATAIRACAGFLDAQPDGSVLALCGSFPGWEKAAFDPLRLALKRWLGRGPLVADVYGPPLAWLAEQPLALVKINADELRPLAADLAHLPAAAHAENWIVTNGAAPVQLRDRDGALGSATPPVVHEVSPTGSGDVFFACVLHALYGRRMSLRDAVSFALPYAAANAAHPGVAEFPEPLA